MREENGGDGTAVICPSALSVLRLNERDVPALVVLGGPVGSALHVNQAGVEIDVGPLERADFAGPQACERPDGINGTERL
jgi:hypothetical protein